MHQLLYISTATELAGDDVSSIVEVSQDNNRERQITGFLLFNGRNFLQLIEGPEASLMALMGILLLDPRHHALVQVVSEPVAARACPDWQMRHIRLADRIGEREDKIAGDLPGAITPAVWEITRNFARLN